MRQIQGMFWYWGSIASSKARSRATRYRMGNRVSYIVRILILVGLICQS